MPDLTPLHDRVLVEPYKPLEEVTEFGLILPKDDPRKSYNPLEGTVLIGGEDVDAGDRILFSRFAYDPYLYHDKLYYLVHERHILAIINN